MKYRTLGRTGIQVSEIGFGTGPTAGLMVFGTPAEQTAAVKRAWDLGITYFDTAPIYGEYASEENLGRAFQQTGVRPRIATKVALEVSDLENIPGAVRRSVEDSLRRLRADAVTLVQVHNRVGSARKAKGDLGVGALLTVDDLLGPVLDTLQQLRQEGKTQAIGCCAWGGEVAAVNQLLDSGVFDTVLVGYSILNPTSGRTPPPGFRGRDFGSVIARAADHGTNAVVLKVLESGALSGAAAPHPTSVLARRASGEFHRNAERARSLGFLQRDGQTSVQAAIRFALMKTGVSVVLVGFSALDQIEEAAGASTGATLTPDDLDRIEELYRSDFGLGALV